MRKITICLSLALAFVLASFCPAQTAPAKRPMTFEDLMKMKRLGETAVSPDGKWLAYSVTTVNLDQNTKTAELWIQAIAGPNSESQAPKKLGVAQPGDSGIQFASDGHSVLFLSGREGGQQIWQADFDAATGATANPKKLTAISTEAADALWSPDGNSVLFTSTVYPDCPAITPADAATGDKCNADRDAAAAVSKVKAQIFTHLLYRHWDHFTGEKRSHLFLLTVATGALRDLTPNDPHDVPPFSLEGGGCGCAFAPDSKELAFTENLDLTNPAAKPVAISTSQGGNFNPAYSLDGKFIAWRSEARAGYESDLFKLVVYDRAAKTVKDLLPKFDRWVDEFAWASDSEVLYYTSGNEGETPIFQASFNGQSRRITEWNGEYSSLHSLPQSRIVATKVTVDGPAEAYLVHYSFTPEIPPSDQYVMPTRNGKISISETETGEEETWITHINDDLVSSLDLPKMESFWFTATDKTKLQGFLIRPPGFDPTKKYPLKLLIHGGPQGAWGDSWSYRWNAELFAANGYVVVMINPRGSTGYGQAIVDGVNGDWGGKLRRFHGQLDSGPYRSLQVHRQPRRNVQSRIGLGNDRRAVVQRVGVQGQALGLLRQARRGESLPQVVPGDVGQKLQDAHAGDSQPARLPPRRRRGLPALRHVTAAQGAQQDALLPRRRPLGAEAAERTAVVQDGKRLGG